MRKHTSKPSMAELWKNHRELCADLRGGPPLVAEDYKAARKETELVKALAAENKKLRERLKLAVVIRMVV